MLTIAQVIGPVGSVLLIKKSVMLLTLMACLISMTSYLRSQVQMNLMQSSKCSKQVLMDNYMIQSVLQTFIVHMVWMSSKGSPTPAPAPAPTPAPAPAPAPRQHPAPAPVAEAAPAPEPVATALQEQTKSLVLKTS